MKHVLQILEQLSPRTCRLLAQIWELTSLNFFVLIQLAQSVIDENEQLHTKSKNAEHFHQEMMVQQKLRMQQYEADHEKLRHDSQELRAELQKTRQKQNRLAVENSQLHQAISGIIDNQDPLSNGTGIAHIDFEEDVAVVGDAEEREFYGINGDELEKVEEIHPVESFSQDLEQLFQGLYEQEQNQIRTLNDLDRFINSNSVSLLWRYGSSEEEHRMMQKMMSARVVGTQTEQVMLERRAPSDLSSHTATDDNDDDDHVEADNEIYASGETGNATIVTKRKVIPASLRAQLDTRPKIQRVLEKDDLNRIVLRLYLEKLDSDAIAVRARKPRTPFHAFMKQFFLGKYGIARLADYHMMEVVKTCLFYHEHHEIEHCKLKGLGLVNTRLVGCYPAHEGNHNFCAADIRITLFSRVCELVPLELTDVPVNGNLFSCAFNALVDVIGDVIELGTTIHSLEDVCRLPSAEHWECSSELALAVLGHHLVFIDRKVLEDASARIVQLSSPSELAGGVAHVSVDIFLAVFISTWFEYDQVLTKKLRDGFRRQLMALSPFGDMAGKNNSNTKEKNDQQHDDDSHASEGMRQQNTLNTAQKEPPLESLMRICTTLSDEFLSPLDLDELRTNLHGIVGNNELPSDLRGGGKRRKSSTKKCSIALAAPASVCIGGVSEKEFVFTVLQCLRARRNCYGIRTNSRLLPVIKMNQLCTSKQLAAFINHDHDQDIPLEKLKPVLESTRTTQSPN
uniref:Uncharacterized protein n=1 Tax=Globisporangium ultimum (strain ATCC 200006 / CBS 805.95 / DAOM BR144) TaxID=431595 RepID=K3X8F3_GLOUD